MTEQTVAPEKTLGATLLPMEEFVAAIYDVGKNFYHDKHPLHRRMYQGKLSKEEIQGWVANRFYYQTQIPIKDGLILSKSNDKEVRREWIHRITDHDGDKDNRGGIEMWLDLAEAVGLDRQETADLKLLLPNAKAAVDSYAEFVMGHPLFECVAVSLTELFASRIHKSRIDSWPEHYPWVDKQGYTYFRDRLTRSPPDAAWGLEFVKEAATTPDLQRRAREAVLYKCNLLWDLATAIEEGFSPERKAWKPKLSKKARLRFDEIEQVDFVLLPEKGLKLTENSAEIVKRCDGEHTRSEIIAGLQEALSQEDPREVKISAMIFIDEFEQKGILE